MFKVTKFNEETKTFNVKDSENKSEKIQVIDNIVYIDGKKIRQTLKKAKEIIEQCNCYLARKIEKDAKEAKKFNDDVQKTYENEVVNEVQETFNLEEKEKNNDIPMIEAELIEKVEAEEIVNIENEEKNEEIIDNNNVIIENNIENTNIENDNVEKNQIIPSLGNIFEEKEKSHFLDVLMNDKQEEYSSFDFHVSNVEPMCDARCKAHKENIGGSLNRFTNFTIYVGSDSVELNKQLLKAIALVMENELECYSLLFDMENIVEYSRGNMIVDEVIMKIPYQSGISDIRKNTCKAYYLAKKKVMGLYRALKKIKLQQEKGRKMA